MLGDIGGLMSILISIFSFILTPIINHFFLFAAFEKLYLAKSENQNLF